MRHILGGRDGGTGGSTSVFEIRESIGEIGHVGGQAGIIILPLPCTPPGPSMRAHCAQAPHASTSCKHTLTVTALARPLTLLGRVVGEGVLRLGHADGQVGVAHARVLGDLGLRLGKI